MSTARNWSNDDHGPSVPKRNERNGVFSGPCAPTSRARATPEAGVASSRIRTPSRARPFCSSAGRVGQVLARRRLGQQDLAPEQPPRPEPRAELDLVAGHLVQARLALAQQLERAEAALQRRDLALGVGRQDAADVARERGQRQPLDRERVQEQSVAAALEAHQLGRARRHLVQPARVAEVEVERRAADVVRAALTAVEAPPRHQRPRAARRRPRAPSGPSAAAAPGAGAGGRRASGDALRGPGRARPGSLGRASAACRSPMTFMLRSSA